MVAWNPQDISKRTEGILRPGWQRDTMRNLGFVILLFSLTSTILPIAAISGFLLVLLVGFFLRTLVLGKPSWNILTADGLLVGFSESYAFSMILLSPSAYLAPALFQSVSFPWFVFGCGLLLGLVSPYLHGTGEETTTRTPQLSSRRTPLITSSRISFVLWIGLMAVSLLVGVHMAYGSFIDSVTTTRDLTLHISTIQGVATGLYPPPSLTRVGSTLLGNPYLLTFSMGYFGILMATMQMTHVGEIFVI
ncbi:MAG: hypothetical protein ACW99J_17325, partial [Candidatus Thorarchaeota archaeon]